MHPRRKAILMASLLVTARASAQPTNSASAGLSSTRSAQQVSLVPTDFNAIRVTVLGLTSARVSFASYSGGLTAAKYRIKRGGDTIAELTAADVGDRKSVV